MASERAGLRADQVTRRFVWALIVTDVLMAALAFAVAYLLRSVVPIPEAAEGMGPLLGHASMLLIHVLSLLGVFFFADLYSLSRASRVD